MSNYTNCARCEAELSIEYQAEVARDIAGIARATHHVISVRPVCDKCNAELERLADIEALKRRYFDAEEAGDIPVGLSKYRKPPKALVAQNRPVWLALARDQEIISGRRCVWLHGLGGVGKSSLCKFLLTRIFEAGGSVACIKAVEFDQRLTSYNAEYEIRKLSRVRGLLIDDLDAANTNWSPRGVAVLRAILDDRHEAGRPTMITSNAEPKTVREMFAKVVEASSASTMLERLRPRATWRMEGGSYRVQHLRNIEQGIPEPQRAEPASPAPEPHHSAMN